MYVYVDLCGKYDIKANSCQVPLKVSIHVAVKEKTLKSRQR